MYFNSGYTFFVEKAISVKNKNEIKTSSTEDDN